MTEQTKSPAQLQREHVHHEAFKIGIDEEYISILVDSFYDRIRSHQTLGPIFAEAIGSNWQPHLTKMKDFWSSVAISTGRYHGQPVPAHQKLTRVQQHHFGIWLDLFRQTLVQTAPTPQAVDYFMERAQRIACSLQIAMFDRPGQLADY
jgi:hemoglobin